MTFTLLGETGEIGLVQGKMGILSDFSWLVTTFSSSYCFNVLFNSETYLIETS